MRATCLTHLTLVLITLIVCVTAWKLRSSSLCSLLQPSAWVSQREIWTSKVHVPTSAWKN